MVFIKIGIHKERVRGGQNLRNWIKAYVIAPWGAVACTPVINQPHRMPKLALLNTAHIVHRPKLTSSFFKYSFFSFSEIMTHLYMLRTFYQPKYCNTFYIKQSVHLFPFLFCQLLFSSLNSSQSLINRKYKNFKMNGAFKRSFFKDCTLDWTFIQTPNKWNCNFWSLAHTRIYKTECLCLCFINSENSVLNVFLASAPIFCAIQNRCSAPLTIPGRMWATRYCADARRCKINGYILQGNMLYYTIQYVYEVKPDFVCWWTLFHLNMTWFECIRLASKSIIKTGYLLFLMILLTRAHKGVH